MISVYACVSLCVSVSRPFLAPVSPICKSVQTLVSVSFLIWPTVDSRKGTRKKHGRASRLERAICTWDPPKWLLLHQGTHVSGLSLSLSLAFLSPMVSVVFIFSPSPPSSSLVSLRRICLPSNLLTPLRTLLYLLLYHVDLTSSLV